MKRAILWLLILALLGLPAGARAQGAVAETSYIVLFTDMVHAYEHPSPEAVQRIDDDTAAMNDPVATAIAERWKQIYLDPTYKLLLYGQDDPREIPVRGKHAFVVLGFQLVYGEMTDELKGRCDAAAAAALAFPDSLVVCTGGVTGDYNRQNNTEAGLMKAYLEEVWGIDPARILTEEEAVTTVDNVTSVIALLKEQQVETLTVVTSAYHQQRGQSLYAAMAAVYQREHGYAMEVVGDYSYAAPYFGDPEYLITIFQLCDVIGLPHEERQQLARLLFGE